MPMLLTAAILVNCLCAQVPRGVAKLSLEAPAYVGMPVWIHLDRLEPYRVRYPYSIDPWDFGGAEFEVRREGAVLPQRHPRPAISRIAPGLSNGTSALPGSPQSRLPLHLVAAFDRPGRYEVRFVGYEKRVGRNGEFRVEVDRSEWFEFEILPLDRAQRDAWLSEWRRRLAYATAGELTGDLLPSALALRAESLIPILLEMTFWSDTLTPRESGNGRAIAQAEAMVRQYAAGCLRAFDEQAVRRAAVAYAREHGPATAMLHAGILDRTSLNLTMLRRGLESPASSANAGALEGINTIETRELDRQVLEAGNRIVGGGDTEAVEHLCRVLYFIPDVGAGALLKRVMLESEEPAMQSEAALFLATRDDPEAFSVLLTFAAKQPEFCDLVRNRFPEVRGAGNAEVLGFLRRKANGMRP